MAGEGAIKDLVALQIVGMKYRVSDLLEKSDIGVRLVDEMQQSS